MIRVLIADDHKMFVDGIESILKPEDGIEVVAKCYNGGQVEKLVEEHNVDLLLLDVNLPGMNGIEVCKRMQELKSEVKIIAISMFNEESYVSEILSNGASGYVLKNTGREELLKAVKNVHAGLSYFSEEVKATIMKGLMGQNKKKESAKAFFPKVSKREKEVLALIIDEHTTQEIANKLFISLKTVESHRSSLLNKLNARNTAGLVRIAIENKILAE